MKTVQRGGPSQSAHRCIVVYGSLFLLLGSWIAPATAQSDRDLHDYAEVFVNQYFEPDERLILSEEGRKKSSALAHYALGRSLEAQGKPMEAVEAYLTVLENQPDQHFLARKTAYLLARSGNNDRALALLESNLENNPEVPFAYISLSEYLVTYEADEPESRVRALQILEEAVDKFPDDPAAYDPLVRFYMVNNRPDDAMGLIEEAANRLNDNPAFWLEIGKIASRIRMSREDTGERGIALANRLHDKAMIHSGGDPNVVEAVGDYYHATNQLDDAIKAFQRVIRKSPDRLDVREKLARVYGAQENVEMVISTLKEIVEIDPESARTHKQLADLYFRQEKFKEAIPHLRKALSITKGSAAEYGALAQLMMESQEYEAADEFLAEAIYLFPEVPDFPYYRAISLNQLERWEEALELFAKAVDLAGEKNAQMLDQRFYFSYGAAYERLGKIEEAEKKFRKSLELIAKNDPDHQQTEFVALVYNYLGYMWLENDLNVDEAGELIKTAADLNPQSGAIADSLGWFYFKKGEFEKARDELLRAESLFEKLVTAEDAVIYDHIAQAFFQLGEFDRAIEYMEKAVALDSENEEMTGRLEDYRKSKAVPTPAPAEDSPSQNRETEAESANKAA